MDKTCFIKCLDFHLKWEEEWITERSCSQTLTKKDKIILSGWPRQIFVSFVKMVSCFAPFYFLPFFLPFFFFFSFCIWCLSGPTFTTLPTLLIYSRDPLAPSLGFSCPASSNFHRLAIIVCIRLPSHSSWLAIFGLSTFALCPWGPIKGSSGYICGQGTRTRVLRQADIAPPGSSKVLVNNEKWSECRSTSLHSIFFFKKDCIN